MPEFLRPYTGIGGSIASRRAAKQAGYPEVTIIEEPQAAFYAWIERNPDWREQVRPGDLILVVDIGGGTTDFTLISVTEKDGELQLERVAVGEHLLLGGDNMDLALARYAEQQFAHPRVPIGADHQHIDASPEPVSRQLIGPDGAQADPET